MQKEILITTYQSAYLSKGGGEHENIRLQRLLNQEGLVADLYGPQSRPVSAYDTVIHFSLSEDSASFLHQIRSNVRQMVLWPNFWLVQPISEDRRLILQELVDLFEIIIFKSATERDHFMQFFDTSKIEIFLTTPGIPNEFFQARATRLFNEVHGIEDYIIWPGIIEPQKNQLTAIQALKGYDIPVVFSGSARDSEYLAACHAAAEDNILFLPEMPFLSDIHLSALMNSRLFLELPLDFPGISAVEAASLGCRLVLTDCEWSREMFDEQIYLADPKDCISIRRTVDRAVNTNAKTVDLDLCEKFRLPEAYAPLIERLRA